MLKKMMMVSAIALVGASFVSGARAETVETSTTTVVKDVPATKYQSTTVTQQKDIPGVTKINFSDFDVNHDGILSMQEVGKKLFYIFDTDGNEVIDNIEFNKSKVMTIIPMEAKTITLVDYDNDGVADQKSYTYEAFLDQSGLAIFDKDKDGLSASEFINTGFQKIDTNDNNTIEPQEWDEIYASTHLPEAAKQERYRQ